MIDLEPMWLALARYQPHADLDGHGESWRKMCNERTEELAVDAEAAAWSARTANWGALAGHWEPEAAAANAARLALAEKKKQAIHLSEKIITQINQAIKKREHVQT